jgi:hypothetical protein
MEVRNIREVRLKLGREMHMPGDVCRETVWKAGLWKTQNEIKVHQIRPGVAVLKPEFYYHRVC